MNGVNVNDHMKYDVFISAKSEDYDLAEGVQKFLVDNGLSVFLADKELRKIGKSEYGDVIDMALDAATHMIVVASCIDYIRSSYVHYEWSVFSNDLKSGYRTGNLLTILTDGISLRELPPSLRHQQSYSIDVYQQEILGYLGSVAENNRAIMFHGKRRRRKRLPLLVGAAVILSVTIGIGVGIVIGIAREALARGVMNEVWEMKVQATKENVLGVWVGDMKRADELPLSQQSQGEGIYDRPHGKNN